MAGWRDKIQSQQPAATSGWRSKIAGSGAAPTEASQEEPRGRQVYASPVGPNPDTMQRIKDIPSELWRQVKDPNWEMDPNAKYTPEGYPPPVAGTPPLVAPAASLGKAGQLIQKVMQYMPTRLAASTGVGALQDREHPGEGALKGLGWGLAGEVAGKIAGGLSSGKNVVKYAANPVAAQDSAANALESADDALRASQQAEADQLLSGHTYKINPHELKGLSPEIDDILNQATSGNHYPGLPSELEISADQGEKIRRILDGMTRFPKSTPVAYTPEIADKFAKYGKLAGGLREQRQALGDTALSDLYDEWSSSLGEAQQMERASKNAPVSFLTREGTDPTALRMRVDARTGSNLDKLGDQLRAAERLRGAKGIEGLVKGAWGLGKETIKGGLQSTNANELDPLALYLQGKLQDKKK